MNDQVIKVNLIPNMGTPAVAKVSQYDVGRPLQFVILDGATRATLAAGTEVYIKGTKPSGLGFSGYKTLGVGGSTITFQTNLAMTQECGRIPCEMRVVDGDDDIGTANFILDVEKTPHAEGTTDGTQETMQNLEARINATIDSMALGIDEEDGLLYLYVNGVKQGEGVDVGGGATRYTITYNLATGIVSSNTATKVSEGSAYASVISSSDADYQVDDITVTMGGVNITSTAVSENEISIPSVTGDIVIIVTALYYPSVETDASTLTITSGGTSTLKVKLHAQPTQSQTVTLQSDALTLSESSLTFTTSNWDTWQTVTVTAPSVEATEYAYITLTNSDPIMTSSSVMVVVKELGYEDLVDTTIPTTGQHIVTTDDFTSVTVQSTNYLQLVEYTGSYTNIIVPASISYNGSTYTPIIRDTSFANNTTLEYATVEAGVKFSRYGTVDTTASGSFSGCSNLVGVDIQGTDLTGMPNTFKNCTSLLFAKGLDNQLNVSSLQATFSGCTSLEYVQDISALTKVTNMQQTFQGCSNLKKIFGVPMTYDSACAYNGTFDTCTSLKRIDIPTNATLSNYSMSKIQNCTVNIYNDGLTTSNITSQTFYQCSNVTVYCTDGSTTEASLESAYGSSLQVTIKNFGGSSTPLIAVWGDSISSPGTAWIPWPDRLQTKLGTSDFLVKNVALSGEWATSTTARQGGYAMTTNAFTIPADTTAAEVTITVNGNETFSTAPLFSAGASFNPCTINGIRGTISRDGSQYYFTRLEAGSATDVQAGTLIVSDNDTVYNAVDNVMIFYLNGNAGWDDNADKLLDMFQKAVNHFIALGGTKYIVAGPAANKLLKNTGFHDAVMEFETKASTAFGNHWLNLREYEIQNGLTQNNLTASELDTERMAQGLVPASLVGGTGYPNDGTGMYDGATNTDENHPNVYGANTIMLAFYEKGVALGYWT